MPAGFKYSLDPLPVEKELCNQATIYRLSGGFNLEDDKLTEGTHLPHLAPLAIDFATRKVKAVKNVKVYGNAAYNATELHVEKNSLAYIGMFLGNGEVAAKVTDIVKTNPLYDVLTISLGVAVTKGDVLFETTGASDGGTIGVYTLAITNNAAAGDKITISGVDYEFAAAEAEDKVAIGGSAAKTALALEEALEDIFYGVFTIRPNGAKLIFTQIVPGVGELEMTVTQADGSGTLVATLTETTEGKKATSVTEPKYAANFLNYARVRVEEGATVTAVGQAFEIRESQLYLPVSEKDKASLGARFMFV